MAGVTTSRIHSKRQDSRKNEIPVTNPGDHPFDAEKSSFSEDSGTLARPKQIIYAENSPKFTGCYATQGVDGRLAAAEKMCNLPVTSLSNGTLPVPFQTPFLRLPGK